MALTTEQVLLLNNLMYMSSGKDSPMVNVSSYTGKTVSDWLNNIDTSQLKDDKDYGSFMTGQDWKNIIQAVKNDDTLMNMTIATTHTDSAGGGGKSAIFTSDSTGDAVVAFQGTAGGEWKDNFTGGNVADTPYQKNALDWYQSAYKEQGLEGYEITITGHSKGGNKAKYITLLDDTVDHCVSFDGQGFSDEFMEKYADRIAVRQGSIENHNVDYDYVNLLLNDVGERTYYHGQDYGAGGFAENHCPNTFMNFDENGGFTMEVNPNGQAPEMEALDQFLNSMIRSLPEDRQTEALDLLGIIADNFLGSNDRTNAEKFDIILELILDSKYSDETAYIFAYLIEYEQSHPEFKDHINSVLTHFGMEDATQYVDIVDAILNFDEDYPIIGNVDFDRLYGWINGLAGHVPDWLWKKLLNWIEDEYGVKFTIEQLKQLLKLVGMVYDDMGKIKIRDNGGDITVAPYDSIDNSSVAAHGRTYVDLQKMRAAAKDILSVAELLDTAASEVEWVASNLKISQKLMAVTVLRTKLLQEQVTLNRLTSRAQQMGNSLETIARQYETAENLILSILS